MKAIVFLLPILAYAGFHTSATMPAPETGAASYTIDPVHSSVVFRVKHMEVAPFWGRFNKISGNFEFDEDGAGSSVEIKIDAASIDTHNERRDRHLKSNDFFSVKEWPEITFKSDKVEKIGDKKYEITGKLKLLGNEKTVSVNATLTGQGEKGRRGYLVGFEVDTTIKRSEFGMKGMIPAISDEVRLLIGIEARRRR